MKSDAGRRVALGMSGGVDSAVSAALLARAGYDVVGVTCRFHDDAATRQAIDDAARASAKLGIPHVVHDCTAAFEREVVSPFVRDYAQGLTPSPCVGCNARVKIPALMEAAGAQGCEFVATGHYARIAHVPCEGGQDETAVSHVPLAACKSETGESQTAREGVRDDGEGHHGSSERLAVLAALDSRKDQSYMLGMLSQGQLARLVLPLGGMTKAEVRILAADLGLEVADKPESQDVCFAGGGYREFLRERGVRDEPGPIVNRAGVVLGHHGGLSNYTVGQRKGIGVAGPEPYYVVEKRMGDHALVVGFADEALVHGVVVGQPNWQALPCLAEPREAMVKLRYRSTPAACIMEPTGNGGVLVSLRSPQPTTAPGQYAVFYVGATVLGGGMIQEVRS